MAVKASAHREGARYLVLWTRLSLIFVVVLGLFALVQAPEATKSYGVTFSSTGWATVVLFLVSLTNVVVTRFLMLPAMAKRSDMTPDGIIAAGYMLALTPTIYGLTSVVLSGEGWLSLPFTLLSLFAIVELRVYFAEAYEQTRD
jgi:hypothetical protein